MSTDSSDRVGNRTRNLAWYTHGVMPLLRRSAAEEITSPPVTEESRLVGESTMEQLLQLRPITPTAVTLRPARPGVGRHRSATRVPWLVRAKRAFARS